jgi:heme/copper-type cytochrome/quinol oxidase subunit 3
MPNPPDKPGFFDDRHTHLPHGTGAFGMWLFLIALGILFAASMVGYLVIRLVTLKAYVNPVTGETVRQAAPALGSIAVPAGLWVSTAVMLASSFTIHLAVRAIQQERQAVFRRCLAATLALAAMFLVIQVPSLWELLNEHLAYRESLRTDATLGLMPYGMVFFLIVIHALHLVGGLIPLGLVTHHAWQHRYDHESYGPVKYTAMYWHFLDVVWVCLFAGFLLIG